MLIKLTTMARTSSSFSFIFIFVFVSISISISSSLPASSSYLTFSLTHRDSQASPFRSHDADPSDLPPSMPMREFVAVGRAMRNRLQKQSQRKEAGGGGSHSAMGRFSYLKENVGDFYLTIPVGRPAQELVFTLDTGSELTWSQCVPCKVCADSGGPTFAFNASTSYQRVSCLSPLCTQSLGFASGCSNATKSCVFQLQYGDGSVDAGYVSVEDFHFGKPPGNGNGRNGANGNGENGNGNGRNGANGNGANGNDRSAANGNGANGNGNGRNGANGNGANGNDRSAANDRNGNGANGNARNGANGNGRSGNGNGNGNGANGNARSGANGNGNGKGDGGNGISRRLIFGCAVVSMDTVPIPISGVMGLSAGPFSFVSQLLGPGPGKLGPARFAYCLPDRFRSLNSKGTIQFGGYRLPGGLRVSRTPLAPPLAPLGSLYYYVNLVSISVGPANINVARTVSPSNGTGTDLVVGGGGTIFDSGTAISHLVAPVYDALLSQFRAQTRRLRPFAFKATDSDLCFRVPANSTRLPSLPLVTFHFSGSGSGSGSGSVGGSSVGTSDLFTVSGSVSGSGGGSSSLGTSDLVLEPEALVYPAAVQGEDIVLCFAFVSSGSTIPLNVIGNYQQQNHWIEYDLETSSLGIAKASCPTH